MNRTQLIMVASLFGLVAMLSILRRDQPDVDNSGQVMLFCAASNRAVMEEIRDRYQEEFGRDVGIQYGPSQTLLSQLEVSQAGDLFLPADDSYLTLAADKGLVAEVLPLAQMQAVIAVKKGNPKSIQSYEDLLKADVRLVQASDAAAIGKLTRTVMQEAGLWDDLDKATVSYRGTVTEAANDVVIGAADASIVYDAVLHTYPDLEYVEIPELEKAVSKIAIGASTHSKTSAAALHFARYVAAEDRGLTNYQSHGFRVTNGDQWSDVPSLKLFAGSMLRPAIEQTIVKFQEREGVQVETVYNGCGILVAQMKAGQVPDAYFACDVEFMEQVPDLFPEPTDVSQNELIILVEKGNPHQIATLSDLSKEGLRVGVGHEKQCAMGWLTQNTFREGGIQKEVMSNVTVQSPTGDMLVNQMQTGSLDAAVVYLSNAVGTGDKLDAVRIQGLECSIATQPYAVAPESPNAQTASRLFQQICSAESQADFAKKGFGWKLQKDD